MTVKTAIQLTEWLLQNNTKFRKGLLDPQMPWNKGDDIFKKLTSALAEITERDSKVLRAIRKELDGNCKHPKKLRQMDSVGNLYCMGCNQDL
jgi:hypothetical protein